MASNTTRLNLYKINPSTDGDMTFNIQTMLNDNWDKIDANVAKTTDIPTIPASLPANGGNSTTVNNHTAAATPNTTEQNDLIGMTNEVNTKVASHLADNTKQIPHLGTTTNSGDAYSITTTETINTNQKFTIKFNAVSSSAPTLKINTGSACAIKKANGNNAKLYASVYTLFWDGSVFTLLGEGGEYGTATVDKVLTGYSIGTENGLALGTMPNNGAINVTQTTSGQITTIPAGYTPGGQVTNNITIASLGGKRWASGTTTMSVGSYGTSVTNVKYITVSGLTFQPSIVIAVVHDGSNNDVYIAYKANESLSLENYRINDSYYNASGTSFPLTSHFGSNAYNTVFNSNGFLKRICQSSGLPPYSSSASVDWLAIS